MFKFNRNEQVALLLLTGALLVGGGVRLYEQYVPGGLEDFQVRKGAVPVPRAGNISVPTPAPSPKPAAADSQRSRIDLNRASLKDLQRLPGIGPKTARLIVDYRTQHGPFRSLKDLTAIRGIGPKTLARLRPLTTLGLP